MKVAMLQCLSSVLVLLMVAHGVAGAPAETGTAVSAAALASISNNNSSAPAAAVGGKPATATTAAPSTANLITHNNQSLFLTGVNLGNVIFVPFANNSYGLTAQQMRDTLSAAFADIAATGANSIRFWLHIDGSASPSWGTVQGHNHSVVIGQSPDFLDDLKWLLRTACQQHGLLVCVSLWSHDILAVRRLNSIDNRARAVHMMMDDAATAAYINNALLPMIEALKAPMSSGSAEGSAGAGGGGAGGPTYLDAVVGWDVLNEPEGVSRHWRLYKNYMYDMRFGPYTWWDPNTFELLRRRSVNATLDKYGGHYTGLHFIQEDGTFNNFVYHDIVGPFPSEWDFLKKAIVDDRALTTVEVPYQRVLRFINRVAGAIHRAAPGAKVTVGVHSTPYALNPGAVPTPGLMYDHAPFNYYSDQLLVAMGGDPLGTLDFLSIHEYPIWNEPARDQHINLFLNPKAHWGIAKPVVVGEHWEQVLANPSTVTVDNYVHLHNTGYAGGWGWAWFNVSERYDLNTGAASRFISEHKCRGTLRSLYASLPQRLKYAVRRIGGGGGAAASASGVGAEAQAKPASVSVGAGGSAAAAAVTSSSSSSSSVPGGVAVPTAVIG